MQTSRSKKPSNLLMSVWLSFVNFLHLLWTIVSSLFRYVVTRWQGGMTMTAGRSNCDWEVSCGFNSRLDTARSYIRQIESFIPLCFCYQAVWLCSTVKTGKVTDNCPQTMYNLTASLTSWDGDECRIHIITELWESNAIQVSLTLLPWHKAITSHCCLKQSGLRYA